MPKNINKNLHKPGTSYHASLDHCLYIPGLGHVAPDTYSGYGSLLDSDSDDETEATSPFYADSFVPDSLHEEVVDLGHKVDTVAACVKGKGLFLESSRSGSLSPNSKSFKEFCDKFVERQRKKEEKRVGAAVVDEKPISGGTRITAELSPKALRFKAYCDNFSQMRKRKLEKGSSYL